MPVHTEAVEALRFDQLGEMETWIDKTQRALIRLPVRGLLAQGARFLDDEYLGDGETLLRFNEHGFRALCTRLGYRSDALTMLETPALASQVLNDLIRQREILARLDNEEFVVDERRQTIIGLVSASYVGYGNDEFLDTIARMLRELAQEDGFSFQEAYGVNTELTMRFTSQKRVGKLRNSGGESDDITLLGLEFKNSMVGTSAVRLSYFLHRLICSNGMMVPAGAATISRVFHSGDPRSFHKRLSYCFGEVHRKLGSLTTLLHDLAAIEFNPEELAKDREAVAAVFDIIPGGKQKLCDKHKQYLRFPNDCSEAEKRRMKYAHDAALLSYIPDDFGGPHSLTVFNSPYRSNASLFDFLNIFTEYANGRPPAERLEIQSRTGALAKYIADNARKFKE